VIAISGKRLGEDTAVNSGQEKNSKGQESKTPYPSRVTHNGDYAGNRAQKYGRKEKTVAEDY